MKHTTSLLVILLLLFLYDKNLKSETIAQNDNTGIYLAKSYIDELERTRSNALSSPRLVVFITNYRIILYDWNESWYPANISGIENNEFILSKKYQNDLRIFIIDENTIEVDYIENYFDDDKVVFCKIGSEITDDGFSWYADIIRPYRRVVNSYIVRKIFGDNIYKDDMDNELTLLENERIFWKNNEYVLGTSKHIIELINSMTGEYYDYMVLDGHSASHCFCFRIINDKRITIFPIEIPPP